MKEFYQMSLIEQLQAARIAYLVTLEDSEESTKFAVYLNIEGFDELKCLWPHEVDCGFMLDYQVYAPSSDSNAPAAYYFDIDEMNTSRHGVLANVLRHHNPELNVLWLNGGTPSRH